MLGVEESGRLRLLQTCTVAGVPRSMALDHRQTVWLLLSDVCHPLCCLGWSEEEQLCACQHPLEQKCCQLLRGSLQCAVWVAPWSVELPTPSCHCINSYCFSLQLPACWIAPVCASTRMIMWLSTWPARHGGLEVVRG